MFFSFFRLRRSGNDLPARQPGQSRRRRRPLGIEAMEGRRMLSAMSLDATTLALPVIPLNLQSFTVVTPADQVTSRIAVDGGFISLGGLQGQSFSVSQGRTVVVRLNDIIGSNSDTLAFPGAGTTAELFLDHGPAGAGFDFRPAVISPTEPGSVPFLDSQPIVAGETSRDAGRQEGGAIRIETILRIDERIAGIDRGEGLASLLAERSTGPASEFHRSEPVSEVVVNRPTAPADSAWSVSAGPAGDVPLRLDIGPALGSASIGTEISGEWARAMVFEMAGGEPAGALRNAATQPLSSIRSATPAISPPAAARPASDSSATRAVESAARLEGRMSADDFAFALRAKGSIGTTAAVPAPSILGGAHQELSPAEIRLTSFRMPSALYDEVFERLHREAESAAPPSVDDDRPANPLLAAPLLAMLVAERIASGYLSRANERATVALAGPPRPTVRRGS